MKTEHFYIIYFFCCSLCTLLYDLEGRQTFQGRKIIILNWKQYFLIWNFFCYYSLKFNRIEKKYVFVQWKKTLRFLAETFLFSWTYSVKLSIKLSKYSLDQNKFFYHSIVKSWVDLLDLLYSKSFYLSMIQPVLS
jgi:hypothetical protein